MKTLYLHCSMVHEGPLVLVNASHPLKHLRHGILTAADYRYPSVLINIEAAKQLQACLTAVGASDEIVPVSGFRSMAEQEKIWADTLLESGEDFTKKYVAIPGCSEHQSGLAIDLGRAGENIDFICPELPYDGIFGKFRERIAEYGFIERYQEGKEGITEISPEPWHFRYVGVPHAALIHEYGLCLEEYRAMIYQKPRRLRLADDQLVNISHVSSKGEWTALEEPQGRYEISGDNVDGFIVTVWESE